MVHNGIEYGDMELICEAYHLMKTLLGLSCQEMHEIFARWNESRLNSYLIEITGDILAYRDEDGEPCLLYTSFGVYFLKIPAMIMTLATGSAVWGIAYIYCNGAPKGKTSEILSFIANGKIGGIILSLIHILRRWRD